ncbi:aldehyde dehydrogenase family protein [Streptomyces sp. NPDC057638]|uniref:aldehyde dehydrogenase family protein n=1 Tax=Streptomyces sp. NPDC057638 TaxID=3346190 RepID=UPI00369F6161
MNPATGDPGDPVVIASARDISAAVASARAAFASWRDIGVERRGELLRRAADILEKEGDGIGAVITAEMGRPLAESVPEVTKSATFLRYFADTARDALAPTPLDLAGLTLPEKKAHIRYEPRGVVAVVKPWNAPVQQVVWALGPALVAGCTVIVKPSEYTPASALALQSVFDRAGFPEGVVQTLPGDADTGRALLEHEVDMVAFTGSVASGRDVAATMGRKLRKCVLELSGKDALIVDPRVQGLDLVAAGIVYGAFSNCGHWCSSVERVFLPDTLADELTGRVVDLTRKLRVGPGASAGVDIGPVANRKQYEVVASIVDDALARGARALTGGAPLSVPGHEGGLFYAPTVLVDVPADARLARENVFGPVVAIHRFSDVREVLDQANDTSYGLGLSVWTDDPEFAEWAARGSDTGMVWVNEPLQSIAACPWSVCKDSGIGVELGAAGVREFTYEKVVQAQFDGNHQTRPWYFPYS